MSLLEEVATSSEYLWNGVVATPEGRLFASLPGWMGTTPGVVEVLPGRGLRPFPGNRWNSWQPGGDATRAFVDVNSITSDGRGGLWVLDAAAPRFGDAIEGAVKVVELDIDSGETRRVITFGRRDAHPGTRLAHMCFHGDHAFMVESKEASIFVIDLRDNSYRRILVGHPLLRCAPEDRPTVEGRAMELNGRPMYFHSDLLAFGRNPDGLLFMCLFGRRIFQADVCVLKDATLSDEQIARHVSVACKLDTPFVSGIARDGHGRLYLGDAENSGISRLNEDGSVTPLVRDPCLSWPIGLTVGADGWLYFHASQVHRTRLFTGGPDRVERPWRMYRLRLDG